MSERTTVVARFLAHRSAANREAVIEAHGYLCKRGARKFRRRWSDGGDLEQVAAVGLIKATDSYRAERSTPFEAYAWLVIVGELMHYVRDHERPIRIPRWLRSLERRYATAWEELASRDQSEPTSRELAEALGVGLGDIEHVRALNFDCHLLLATPPPSLSIEERIAVLLAVDELSERERTVVLGTFVAGLSQAEIARTLGLSQSQISKILCRALAKLHEAVAC